MNTILNTPTNKAEYIRLLDEAIRLADSLNAQLDCIDEIIDKDQLWLIKEIYKNIKINYAPQTQMAMCYPCKVESSARVRRGAPDKWKINQKGF